jgi:hypothetical protein
MKKQRKQRRRGDLPGEYVKRSLVTVTLDSLGPGGRYDEDHYILQVRRLDNLWSATIEYKGERWVVPHRVLVTLGRMQKAIIKARRSDHGREIAERLIAQAMQSGEGDEA